MGGVLGEDAIELGAGATNCISDCQARNSECMSGRAAGSVTDKLFVTIGIQGSATVPPDPTSQSPLPVKATRRSVPF